MAARIRSQAARARTTVQAGWRCDGPGVRSTEYLKERTARISPTALETFLQCPFQYFAGRLLRLKGSPGRPGERLDFLTQGGIVHEVLATWWNTRQDIGTLFE